MNKIILFLGLLIGFSILISCSKNDNNSESSVNLIIGTWKPIKEVDVCSTGSEEVFHYSSCRQQGRYTFVAHNNPDIATNGPIHIIVYFLENEGCILFSDENGTWTLEGDNLTITIGGEVNTPTFFELTSNTLRVGYYDADPNDPCDGGNLPSHYYTEFIRV